MSMPMELEEEGRGRSAQYDAIAVEYSRGGGLSTSLPYGQVHKHMPETCGMMIERKMERFRSKCCSCCSAIPNFLLIVMVILLFGLAIFAVVGAIILARTGSTAELKMNDRVVEIIRPYGGWPSRLDEDEDIIEGIRAKSMFPPNVSDCAGFGFACTSNPGLVISTVLRCNGVADCADGSDEVNCQECQSQYSCPANPSNKGSKTKICLSATHLCDGVRHCPDGWDEQDHCKSECSPNEIRCTGSNKCLPDTVMCDGIKDCDDGGDEKLCSQCERGSKYCPASDTCISQSKLCDGHIDCADGSDEKNCNCRSCSGTGKMLCADGTCLNSSRVCDGVFDCLDGMDEMNCPGSCPLKSEEVVRSTIQCADGLIYPLNEACTGLIKACSKSCPKCDKTEAFTCKNGKCIHRSQVCDGKTDCANGEDELKCDSCPVMLGHWKCISSKKCVPETKRCDGVFDCTDGSDERECDECPAGSFICPVDKVCLPMRARCDGVIDCRDHADEKGCSCADCLSHLSNTYMCEGSGACLRRSEVCSPYSNCPNATKADRFFCAKQFTLPKRN